MSRRLVTVALALVVVAGAATPAQAAVRAGTYKGRTAQEAQVSLRVVASRTAVVRYSIEGGVLECSDGRPIQLQGFTSPSSERFPIDSRGIFAFVASGNGGAVTAEVRGRIRSPRASGSVRFRARLNDARALDPNGTTTCDSGRVRWSARRR